MRRFHRLLNILPAMLVAVLLLASCSASGVGTIPNGTPNLGNGTPAVLTSPSPTVQSIATAPPSALGATYAYARDNQLWVAQHGAPPAKVTSFPYGNLPDVSWHQPAWSPGDQYLAFIMNALPAGQGGGGCPAPDYSANGALFVLDTATMQLTPLQSPSSVTDPLAGNPYHGYWQYVFWQDATHLLAWYNGVTGATDSAAGLYRYDVTARKLVQALPLSALGVATLFSGQSNMPLLLSMRYSSGQLYYQVVTHPFTQQSRFAIYRYAIGQSQTAGSKVADGGGELWCGTPQTGPFVKPGWDISPDGAQLAMQVVTSGDPSQASSAIETLSLVDGLGGLTTPLLTQLPTAMQARDMVLAWGPDSQALVASESHLYRQEGPYSATLANPAAMQRYVPNAAGAVAWKPDGSAFAMQSLDATDLAGTGTIYMYTTLQMQGQLLLSNVRDFVWG